MISNNKILTVSYGTFSCTLEGFDDSFHTMKAIAEYFRDLASDDRYFGAEPPQPDAEMLARIAEREIARRVEARTNDGRIFLSATAPEGAAPEAAAPATPHQQEAAAPQAAAAAPAPVAPVAKAAAPVAETPAPVAAPHAPVAEQNTPELAPESDAVQLQDVDSGTDAQDFETETPDGIDDAFDHANAGDMLAPVATGEMDATEATAEAFFAESHTETAEDAIEEAADNIAPEIAIAEELATPARDRVVPHADSIAAKLERIRAVVSQADDEDLEDDYSEDEHAEGLVADAAHAEEAFEDEADDVIAAQDDALMKAMMDQAEDEADDTVGTDSAADIAAEAAADVYAALDEDDSMTMIEDDDDEEVATILARLDRGASDEDDDALAESDVTAEEETPDAQAAIPHALADDSADLPDDSDDMNLFDDDDDEEIMIVEEEDDADATAAAPAPRITRIVKVKRSELEAAIAQGNLEEMDDDDEEDKTVRSSLSDEDEDALLRELADVEADLTAAEKDDIEQDEDTRVAAAMLDAADDGDMDRLMAKADAEMGEPESARRRDAFAHLRAAVAAKNSDEGIVGAKIAETALEVRAYQTDLADVVKPRRPEVRGIDAGRRPDVQRPAPLKLVAEQRVNSVPPAAVTPVTPRRVAQPHAAVETTNGAHSFAEFADDMGAHDLPDLLEAAAAFLAFVEERDQFSRPQLMTKVRQVVGADFSREDSLRSFGQLLRAGKIEKIKGGRFAVSGDIGFRPDQRAAG
jgi:hypothetical protein